MKNGMKNFDFSRLVNADIICIGAGISGAVLAERYAAQGKNVVVLEKRDHVGGNCFDYVNDAGILVAKYGPHFFHTNSDEVWNYLQQFSKWIPYEHRVLVAVDDQLLPIPINITTVNQVFGLNIQTESEMKNWLAANQVPLPATGAQNSQEVAESRVGRVLYEKIFKNYTKKQWDKSPMELSPAVLARIPVRTDFEDRYFTDIYQALPAGGYTKLFENMFLHPNITVMLNTDYFEVKEQLEAQQLNQQQTHPRKVQKLFYTGPIDQFFHFQDQLQSDGSGTPSEQLEYRSLWFEHQTLELAQGQEFYQPAAVVNYPAAEIPYTRIVEYSHLPNQPKKSASPDSSKILTTIVKEHSSATGEPFYPVPNPRNQALYQKLQARAALLPNLYFVGRLANYKYFNMDEAFQNALDLFKRLESTKPGSK